ncbi:unnamed protein product [Timema podura]|uniref:Uncharacterized protein n=1 Tax=Timema podura TaxID=61482 RepID=A0ABN7NHV5_TIMPD|nr:unnamed protein product [Timema podura]
MSVLKPINPGETENCLRCRLMKELIMELISEERISKKSPGLTLTWCDLSVSVKRKHDTNFWTRQRFEQIQILNNGISLYNSQTKSKSLMSHRHWSPRTTHCADPRYTNDGLIDLLTGHADHSRAC